MGDNEHLDDKEWICKAFPQRWRPLDTRTLVREIKGSYTGWGV